MINAELARDRGLSEAAINQIKERHEFRKAVENALAMVALGQGRGELPDRWNLLKAWRANECELQELWGFQPNPHYHKEFRIAGCTCPKEDNEQFVGTEYRYVSKVCPFHGIEAKAEEAALKDTK